MVGIAFKYGAKKAEEAFMCFNVTWSDDKGPQRVMIWDLLGHLLL
jgi:hypothetical protein